MEVKVCTRKVGTTELKGCSKPFVSSNTPGPVKATIDGPINDPFEVSQLATLSQI